MILPFMLSILLMKEATPHFSLKQIEPVIRIEWIISQESPSPYLPEQSLTIRNPAEISSLLKTLSFKAKESCRCRATKTIVLHGSTNTLRMSFTNHSLSFSHDGDHQHYEMPELFWKKLNAFLPNQNQEVSKSSTTITYRDKHYSVPKDERWRLTWSSPYQPGISHPLTM